MGHLAILGHLGPKHTFSLDEVLGLWPDRPDPEKGLKKGGQKWAILTTFWATFGSPIYSPDDRFGPFLAQKWLKNGHFWTPFLTPFLSLFQLWSHSGWSGSGLTLSIFEFRPFLSLLDSPGPEWPEGSKIGLIFGPKSGHFGVKIPHF